MKYFVYILFSTKKNGFYVGQTYDVFQRLKRHNSGKENFTKKYTPWILVWSTEKPTRAEAMKLEKKIKNLSKARILKFCMKYKKGIHCPDEFRSIESKLSE